MKIFFMCTHANQGTGYARVANKITNYLVTLPNVEVAYYAFQNFPGQSIDDRFIDERIKFYDAVAIDPDAPKGFGDAGILPAIEAEKPDLLFLYNDLPVTNALLKLIPKELMPKKVFVYLDVVYPYQSLKMYNELKSYNVDKIIVFSEYWRKHLVEDMKFPTEQIDVMYHGLDYERFTFKDQKECKKKYGFKEDDYIVLNMNRNSYRKMQSVCLEAFVEFLQMNDMNEKIKLYLGCMIDAPDSYNIPMTLSKICLQRNLDMETIMTKHVFITSRPTMMPEEEINTIYNMGDVGINTCCGEGFGLTNIEHLFFNKPQIVTGIPALKDVMQDMALFVEPLTYITMFNFEHHVGEIAITSSSDFAKLLDKCYKEKITQPLGNEYVKERFSWTHMYDKLKQIIV